MTELFGVDIAAQIHGALSGQLLPAIITKVVKSDRDPNNLSAGPAQTMTDYACEGIWVDYLVSEIDGTLVHLDDRKALIIANSIIGEIEPEKGDKITIDATAEILRVERDPASATYTLHCGQR